MTRIFLPCLALLLQSLLLDVLFRSKTQLQLTSVFNAQKLTLVSLQHQPGVLSFMPSSYHVWKNLVMFFLAEPQLPISYLAAYTELSVRKEKLLMRFQPGER